MSKGPKVPMHPTQLPQQKLALVVDLPTRPEPFDFGVGYGDLPEGVISKRRSPRSPIYIAQFEWAETPTSNGVEAFYLEAKTKYWVLWIKTLNENTTPWSWDWLAVAYCNRAGIDEKTAASYLLLEYWRFDEKMLAYRNVFDWVNEVALLSIPEIYAITRELWR
jgi:hypothetical protein